MVCGFIRGIVYEYLCIYTHVYETMSIPNALFGC